MKHIKIKMDLLKNKRIHYSVLSHAIDFYESKNVKYIEVPWIVPKKFCDATRPVDKFSFEVFCNGDNIGVFVGSAEQSFIKMIPKLNETDIYMSVSPCFRQETEDELHSKEFMKLELFTLNPNKDLLELAYEFHSLYFKNLKTVKPYYSIDQHDIYFENIELGSYGSRSFEGKTFYYGTGCALPRMTLKIKEGYHRRPIAKAKIGTVEKIVEEVQELVDAKQQDSKIMQLVELSDLYGAIELYVKSLNVTMDDIKNMSDITKRAFKNGSRK